MRDWHAVIVGMNVIINLYICKYSKQLIRILVHHAWLEMAYVKHYVVHQRITFWLLLKTNLLLESNAL